VEGGGVALLKNEKKRGSRKVGKDRTAGAVESVKKRGGWAERGGKYQPTE